MDQQNIKANDDPVEVGSFPKFSKLPTELHLQIWKHVCFHTRNINILARRGTLSPKFVYYSSRSPPPATLHTCSESRHEELKWYKLGFGTVYVRALERVSTSKQICLNWGADRVCAMNVYSVIFSPIRFFQLIKAPAKLQMRFLALNLGIPTNISRLAKLSQ